MKVLHVIQRPQLRGAEIFASHMCRHLRERGDDVMLLSVFRGEANLPFDGDTIHLQRSYSNRFWDLKSWFQLWKAIRSFRPDVVQANSGFTLKFVLFSKWLFRWKQPVIFRNASTMSQYIHSPLVRWFNSWFIKSSAAVASVSQLSSDDLVKLYPSIKSRVNRIPTGIEEFKLNGVREKNQPFTIIHEGGFTFEKNHKALVEIFARVKKSIPEARLWLVGDGPLKKETEQACANAGISDSVTFFGYQTNVAEYLSSADLLVMTSVIEGMPASILEAFYCRVPVVTYKAGGIAEIVEDEITGKLIAQGDADAFVKAVCKVYSSDEKNNWVNNALQLVTTHYMNAVICDRFRSLYSRLIHQKPAVDVKTRIKELSNAKHTYTR